MKTIVCIGIFFLMHTMQAQSKNIFLDRAFWKTKPTIAQIEEKITEGNSATKLNRYGFDAVVYALLENASTESIKHLLTKKENPIDKLTHDGRTYLFWASYKNNMDIVKHLLSNGAKTDVIDDKGYSVFNFTAAAGVENIALYDLLIAHGATPLKETTPKGANAMLLLVPNLTNFKMISYFSSLGFRLESKDKDGNGVFNYTAQKGNKKMLELLIKKGISYKELNQNEGNAMLFATRGSRRGYNDLDFFKYLENLGIKANVVNKQGKTPIHNIAYSNEDIAAFYYFIQKGVDVNQTDANGNTALMNASYRNSLEIIQLLARNTKNINHLNKEGYSALTRAIRNEYKVLEFFINKGADVSIIDAKGNHLGHYLFNTYAAKNLSNFQQKLDLLASKGLDITVPQKDGTTLYHVAVDKQNISMLNFIEKYNIDINAKNAMGITPLQKAVMTAKDNTLIKLLIKRGANTAVTTDFDESLYDLAKENEALKNSDISYLK